MTILGIDISHYQGNPNFAAVKAAGVGLVFIKATESTNYTDPTFAANRDAARAQGLSVGFYHFARATNADAEAQYFCNAVGSLRPGDLVALDWEVSAGDPVGWAHAWLRSVEARLGVKPLIYLNQSTVGSFDWTPVVNDNYGLWLAKYDNSQAAPTVPHWPFVAIKQYSDAGHINGVAGTVDLDVFEGSAEALAKYGYQGVAPAPAPAPTPPPPPPAPAPAPGLQGQNLPTLAFGQTSNAVRDLQRFCNAYNWVPALPLISLTGYYGPLTAHVLHLAGQQLGVHGDTDGKNFGPHFKDAFWRIGFRG